MAGEKYYRISISPDSSKSKLLYMPEIYTRLKAVNSLWIEINAGYSNHGTTGSGTFNVKIGKFLLSTQYNKSHICYVHNPGDKHFLNNGQSEDHFTVESISFLSGIILPWKWNPGFSIGISGEKFKYVSTIPIDVNVKPDRIWATIINGDYKDETLSEQIVNTIGIPVEIKFHGTPKRFIGLDAGIKVNFNRQSTSWAAELGIRFGRIIRSHLRNSIN
jgi:hypothetical protein